MSSRSSRVPSEGNSHGRGSSQPNRYYPTQWSEWELNTELGCGRRYRLTASNNYEWDYTDFPRHDTLDTNYTPNISHVASSHIPSSSNTDRPHQCRLRGCPAGVTSWARADGLSSHNRSWHGPFGCLSYGCTRGYPNGFASQSELDDHKAQQHGNTSPTVPQRYQANAGSSSIAIDLNSLRLDAASVPRGSLGSSLHSQRTSTSSSPVQVTARDPTHPIEEFDRHYRLHSPWEFKLGRVFKMLWAEPKGVGLVSTSPMESSRYGQTVFMKVRRFVVMDARSGHCLCLPINTYNGRGVRKEGIQGSDHAIIYSGKKPLVFAGEREKGMTKTPIKFNPDSHRHKLDPASRLNYAKIYTVEYNVKVWFMGEICPDTLWQLGTDYNLAHPPLQLQGLPHPVASPPIPSSPQPPNYGGPILYASLPTSTSSQSIYEFVPGQQIPQNSSSALTGYGASAYGSSTSLMNNTSNAALGPVWAQRPAVIPRSAAARSTYEGVDENEDIYNA